MIVCPNCKKELEGETKFCDDCGTQIAEKIFCQHCGNQTSTEFNFCQNCGASLAEERVSTSKEKANKKCDLSRFSFKLSKKFIAIGGAAVALLLVIVILFTTLFVGGNKSNFALYLKDKEIYFTKTKKIEPWQVTDRLFDDVNIDDEDLGEYIYPLGSYTQLSKNGKIIFFIDKLVDDSDGVSLFYRYVDRPNEEAVKIDSDVFSYCISDSGELVTYIKGEEGTLYQHNLTDKEKIASEVYDFYVSDDGKKIGYIDDSGSMYLKYDGKDKEKIDSDVTSIEYINEEFNTAYYIEDETLYKIKEGSDKQKIASKVYKVIKIYESGEVYYFKSNSDKISLLDYVEDDMQTTDAAMVKPEVPDYPSYWDYDDYDDYEAAYEKYKEDYSKYKTAIDDWYDKEERDELREDLADSEMSVKSYSLCYYNGKENKVISDTASDSDYVYAEDKPVIAYSTFDQASLKKAKLSEIDDVYEVEDMIEDMLYSSSNKEIAIKDKLNEIDQKEAKNFSITNDGKTIYFLDNVSEDDEHGDLYKITISGDKLGKVKLYDNKVYRYGGHLTNDDNFVYFKDVKDGKGEFYVDKERIDYDVEIYSDTYNKQTDTWVYLTDWNDKKDYGTLKMHTKGKAIKIADDVNTYEITPNGEVLYLYEYSVKHSKGELFVYKNNKAEKIDDDVAAIIPVYNSKYRGGYYGWR